MPSPKEIFKNLLTWLNQQVELGQISSDQVLRGKVVYVMTDSVMIETSAGNCVVAYGDIAYLNPLEASRPA